MSEPQAAERPNVVLHLEDSARDAEMMRDLLDAEGIACDVVRTDRREEFERLLVERTFDVVICDYNLPAFDGLAALKLARLRAPTTPVIIVSGAINPDEAVACLRAGAADYLLKQRLERLGSALSRAVEEGRQARQRRDLEWKLQESEKRFRQLAEQSRDGFWFVSIHPAQTHYVSPAVETIWGLSAATMYRDSNRRLRAIHPDDRARVERGWEACLTNDSPHVEHEYRVLRPDGSMRWVHESATLIHDAAGATDRLSGVVRDITERKELELQLQHAQKMESVGRLAGGIAHDFNNVLTVINAVAELAIQSLAEGDPLRNDLREIRLAGEHAAALTRQLLAFSRKQVLQPKVLSLPAVVTNTESMLRRILGEHVELVVQHEEGARIIRADASQLEQVIVNLVVNARDAMPEGGTVRIATRNIELTEPRLCNGIALEPGSYVVLSVNDTGAGMDDLTMHRAFEPFFTTKGPEQGTGLGLSTVHGIVTQSGGAIDVRSSIGNGSTFDVFLPRIDTVVDALAPEADPALTHGTETILVAEDNRALRRLACRILRSAGYTVLEAASGEEALQLIEPSEAPIHLLLTDVVMPHINGTELAKQCRAIRPTTRVLFMSGHTDDALVLKGVFNQELAFLGKPYTASELTTKVREVLDEVVADRNR